MKKCLPQLKMKSIVAALVLHFITFDENPHHFETQWKHKVPIIC